MQKNINSICKLTKRIANKQLKSYTRILHQELVAAGCDRTTVESVLKRSIEQLQKHPGYHAECASALEAYFTSQDGKENRGIDPIGRILIEYCFFRVPQQKMLWPENSDKDIEARETFTDGIIPRPLMRYFLVSVRGTIPTLNNFDADSVLYGRENTKYKERQTYVQSLIKDLSTNGTTDWNIIYADTRIQETALNPIGEVRRKIEQLGFDRYLRILENLHNRDPDKTTINQMYRAFQIKDAKLIDESLWAAEQALAESLH